MYVTVAFNNVWFTRFHIAKLFTTENKVMPYVAFQVLRYGFREKVACTFAYRISFFLNVEVGLNIYWTGTVY